MRCGDYLLAYNGESVTRGKLICVRCSNDHCQLSLACGSAEVNQQPSSDASIKLPAQLLKLRDGNLEFEGSVDPNAQLLIATGSKVAVFDRVAIYRSLSPISANALERDLAKLSKLFDGKPSEILANLAGSEGALDELTYYEMNGGSCVGFNTDADHDGKTKPIVDMVLDLSLLDVDKLIWRFISKVRAVHTARGSSLNNKHTEIVLNQMLNSVLVVSGGQSEYKTGDRLTWQNYTRLNKVLRRRKLGPAIGIRMLFGISEVCSAQSPNEATAEPNHSIPQNKGSLTTA